MHRNKPPFTWRTSRFRVRVPLREQGEPPRVGLLQRPVGSVPVSLCAEPLQRDRGHASRPATAANAAVYQGTRPRLAVHHKSLCPFQEGHSAPTSSQPAAAIAATGGGPDGMQDRLAACCGARWEPSSDRLGRELSLLGIWWEWPVSDSTCHYADFRPYPPMRSEILAFSGSGGNRPRPVSDSTRHHADS
jgi:hypothetical protein